MKRSIRNGKATPATEKQGKGREIPVLLPNRVSLIPGKDKVQRQALER